MKTIDELRKGFEEINWVKAFLTGDLFNFINGGYYTFSNDVDVKRDCDWLNGAWFMYQELNK